MTENTTRIPADKEHLLAVAIQNAWNGDFSLIDRLRAEIASAPTPVADEGGGDLKTEARAALGRMKAREGEDVDQWAERLAAENPGNKDAPASEVSP